jgi:hypothetical protein
MCRSIPGGEEIMKITREEFKEYGELYREAWNKFDEYADIIDSNFLDSLMFPVFNWLDKKLGLDDENGGIVLDCILEGGYPVEWDVDEEGNCFNTKRSSDWDVIYDKYVKETEHGYIC